MSMFTRSLAVALTLILCAVAPMSGAATRALRASDFAQVAPGKTREEVRAMLGAPVRALPARGATPESWEYRYRGDFERRSFWVEFGANGAVSRTEDAIDSQSAPFRGP
jgi:hypothetical protein